MDLFYFCYRKVKNEPAIPFACLTFYELTCVFDGSMTYYINNKKVTLKAGDILFAKKDATRRRATVPDCHFISFNFYEAENCDYLELPLHLENSITKEIQLLLAACSGIHSQNTDDKDRLELLCACILKQLKINLETQNYSDLTKFIIKYIDEHLYEKINLEDIARFSFFSPSHCLFIFKKEIGKPIMKYVIDEKISRAKKLIIEGIPLKDVAKKLGFDDYNYFSRLFKKRENITPLQYKQFIYPTRKKTNSP